MKVLSIIGNGFEDLEFIGTIDFLNRAGIAVDIATLNQNNTAIGAHNTKLVDLKNIAEINYKNYDCLFLPGGPHYQFLQSNKNVLNIINYFFNNDLYIAAICAAPTILGKLGLLKNKNYTCFTSMNEDFNGNYIDKYAVRDNKLITGKSPAAVIDFALLLIEALLGSNASNKIKNDIYYKD